jgi:hypothetical protein
LPFGAAVPFGLDEVTAAVGELTRLIERRRRSEVSLTEPEIALLEWLSSRMFEKPKGFQRLIVSVRFGVIATVVSFTGNGGALEEFFTAFVRLRRVVLDAIESTHESYEQEKATAIQDALSTWGDEPALTPEGFRDWLERSEDHPLN